MLIPWLERAPRDDVHPDAQEFLKVLKQADVIKKRRTWLEVHEQLQIAVRASLSPGDGAEHGDPMSPALPGDAEDLRTAAAESLQYQDVIRHVSSVSPRASTTLGSGYELRVRANQPAQQEQGQLPGAYAGAGQYSLRPGSSWQRMVPGGVQKTLIAVTRLWPCRLSW